MSNQITNQQNKITPTNEDILQIADDFIRRKYLARISDMEIVEPSLPDLDEDLIENVRMFQITEMVYKKGEPITDKLTTVFNTISTYNASIIVLIDSDGFTSRLYLGVRNNDADSNELKRSTVTLNDTLRQTLVGHFPGIKVQDIDRQEIKALAKKVEAQKNIAAVSIMGTSKSDKNPANEEFVQGIEKLLLAMNERPFTGLIIADRQDPRDVEENRHRLQEMYSSLSPLKQVQINDGTTSGTSRQQSFSEMDNLQKRAFLANVGVSALGIGVGIAATLSPAGAAAQAGAAAATVAGVAINQAAIPVSMIANQITGQLSNVVNAIAPTVQIQESTSKSQTTTYENKQVADLMDHLDYLIKKTGEYDSYGSWDVAAYFSSDDMSAAEIAASNYRSLMSGENTGREMSAINEFSKNGIAKREDFGYLTTYLSHFTHPRFAYLGESVINAATTVSGKELGLHLGLPRDTVPGIPVIQHAEFGKEVSTYQLIPVKDQTNNPEDNIVIGRIFDLGHVTNKVVQLNNKSLNMHTFITGSTGSGKSNAVYQMLTELRQDGIPFLVVEPAKGEYKDVFGNLPDVRVFSTNPKIAPLINLNPFMFPESIHVLEHIDGLVEIFGVCWPMYDAMPAFFKDAILKSYEAVGWDLGSSTFEGDQPEYPDFETLSEQLGKLIDSSDYADEIKSNYRGALLTRVNSLTVGLNRFIFTANQTPYNQLFDENCILDISRVKSGETKSLIMGLMVYVLNEYRVDQKTESNRGLRHVTVLEEAHNLLKNTNQGASDLTGKSVEMLTNTIAEIRTYGEGFIIVDQSPSSVDIAAIKNTNTKIILRTPEAHDREAVGRSIGLSADQVEEIAKLPSGTAVVYQNNWISPVLTLINKASVEEHPFRYEQPKAIVPVKAGRKAIINMLLQPWYGPKQLTEETLTSSLQVLNLSRTARKKIAGLIERFTIFGGTMAWKPEQNHELRELLQEVLELKESTIAAQESPEVLMNLVSEKVPGLSPDELRTLCYFITLPKENSHE